MVSIKYLRLCDLDEGGLSIGRVKVRVLGQVLGALCIVHMCYGLTSHRP